MNRWICFWETCRDEYHGLDPSASARTTSRIRWEIQTDAAGSEQRRTGPEVRNPSPYGGPTSVLRELIAQALALDPRPACRKGQDLRRYGMRIEGFDVRWRVKGDRVEVDTIVPVVPGDTPGLSASD